MAWKLSLLLHASSLGDPNHMQHNNRHIRSNQTPRRPPTKRPPCLGVSCKERIGIIVGGIKELAKGPHKVTQEPQELRNVMKMIHDQSMVSKRTRYEIRCNNDGWNSSQYPDGWVECVPGVVRAEPPQNVIVFVFAPSCKERGTPRLQPGLVVHFQCLLCRDTDVKWSEEEIVQHHHQQ